MGITTRAAKGAPITATEHDDSLTSLVQLHQGSTAPTTMYASMLWADTATSLMKQRNTANSAWITLGSLDTDHVMHPSGDGNLHVPATSTSNNGKVLTAGSTAGALTWETVSTTDTKWDGGATGLNASTGRTSLGLTIGTTVQAYDATIMVDADIGTTVQAYDSTILKNANIGSTVQAYDADLTTLATNGIGTSANQIVKLDGSAKLPAVDGSALTNLPAGGATDIDGLSDGVSTGQSIGLGTSALGSITSGTRNVAVGHDAMLTVSTAIRNTAIGYRAMKLANGNYNTAVGDSALLAATSARDNVAVGYTTFYNLTTASYNTAVGNKSGYTKSSSGDYNSYFGRESGYSHSSGSYGTFIGAGAGSSATTGSNSSCFGFNAQLSAATETNQIALGNSSVSSLRCNTTSISSLSDQRDKTNIQDIPDSAGIDFINKLRPVTYNWDRREWYEDSTPDGSKIKPDWRRWKPNSGLKQGFIAQEVQTAINGEKCLEDSMIVTNDNLDKLEFAPQHLLTNAIKAIQQLSAENKALIARIEALENA